MTCWPICDKWIDEVQGTRCALDAGHDGPCADRREIFGKRKDREERA